MTEIKEMQRVIQVCEQLKNQSGCDFVALALQNEVGPDVKWHFASGNLNDKYKRITVRFGKGIAGKVISSGSPMMISHFPDNIYGKVTDYPIMLAEKLVATYAVPLFFHSSAKGVLLVGNRESTVFQEKEQQLVMDAAQELEEILQGYISGR